MGTLPKKSISSPHRDKIDSGLQIEQASSPTPEIKYPLSPRFPTSSLKREKSVLNLKTTEKG